jgi:hypothetical protein
MGCNHFITQSNKRTIQDLLWDAQADIEFARIRPASIGDHVSHDDARNGCPGLGLITIQIHPEWVDRHQFFD